eukprot:TRINITY_DN4466_c0_g1_i1.p1 TRINITY_DN4466_c0_g1~~TRINITY_DN4466_c0_g1_i1.p1  ORF type:complete len:270 (-),score=62.93 TRINITY_DN4466_c0_g1_i1:29-838(-)
MMVWKWDASRWMREGMKREWVGFVSVLVVVVLLSAGLFEERRYLVKCELLMSDREATLDIVKRAIVRVLTSVVEFKCSVVAPLSVEDERILFCKDLVNPKKSPHCDVITVATPSQAEKILADLCHVWNLPNLRFEEEFYEYTKYWPSNGQVESKQSTEHHSFQSFQLFTDIKNIQLIELLLLDVPRLSFLHHIPPKLLPRIKQIQMRTSFSQHDCGARTECSINALVGEFKLLASLQSSGFILWKVEHEPTSSYFESQLILNFININFT